MTLTSKIARHSLRRDLLERPSHLSEHAAGVVHQDVDAARGRGRRGDARVDGGPVAHVGDHRAARSAGRRGTALPSRGARRRARHRPRRVRHARRTPRLMARPNPCAAPVTMAVLPLKSRFMGWSRRRRGGGQRVECVERLRPRAALDLVNQRHEARGERRRHAGLGPERDDDAELRVDFGGPLPHGEIAPDAAVRLGRAPVVRDERVERALRRAGRCAGEVCRRIEPVERLGPDAAGRRDGQDLARQRDVQMPVRGHGERVGDRLVGQRRGEEHRAVGFLAPQIAPDVRRHDGARIEVAPRVANRGDARRDAAVDLAHHHGAVAAVVNHPGLEVVGAEVDERADRALGADDLRDRELVEPVLRRHHVAAGGEVRQQCARRRPRCDAPSWRG